MMTENQSEQTSIGKMTSEQLNNLFNYLDKHNLKYEKDAIMSFIEIKRIISRYDKIIYSVEEQMTIFYSIKHISESNIDEIDQKIKLHGEKFIKCCNVFFNSRICNYSGYLPVFISTLDDLKYYSNKVVNTVKERLLASYGSKEVKYTTRDYYPYDELKNSYHKWCIQTIYLMNEIINALMVNLVIPNTFLN